MSTIWFCDNCDGYTKWEPGTGCLKCEARDKAAERYRAEVDKINRATDREINAPDTAGKQGDNNG